MGRIDIPKHRDAAPLRLYGGGRAAKGRPYLSLLPRLRCRQGRRQEPQVRQETGCQVRQEPGRELDESSL